MTFPSDPFFLIMFISAFPFEAIALIGFDSSKAMDPGLSSSMIVTIVLVSPPFRGDASSILIYYGLDGSYN